MKADYSYQDKLKKKVLALVKSGSKEIVLAAGCSSGKTRMSIDLLESLFKMFPNYKALVLAHGQTTLKTQYMKEVVKNVPSFTYGTVNTRSCRLNHQVNVGIPQSIGEQIVDADIIVCDEAHQFYLADTVQKIVKRNKPKIILLLTGSPSKFIAKGYDIVPFSVSELLDHGVISDPRISLIKSTYDYKQSDINEDQELSTSYKLRKANTESTLDLLTDKIVGKTLIACRNNQHAKDVYNYLSKTHDVLLSTSENDIDSNNIQRFITDHEQILVVVYRSILGFSLNNLETVIDISGSHNPDRIFQLMSRAIRKNNTKKNFYKVTTEMMAEYTFSVMSLVVALTQPEVYTTYSGNINNITFPLPKGVISSSRGGHGNEYTYKVFDYHFDSFHEVKTKKDEYAWTTIAEVKKLLYGRNLSAHPLRRILLDMAAKGEDRPKQRTKLGKYLCRVTSTTGYVDEEFKAQLTELCPYWFNARSKEAFLEELRSYLTTKNIGIGSLPKNFRAKLVYWMRKEPSIAKEVTKKKPKWFSGETSADRNKKKLLEMMKTMEERPTKRSSNLMTVFYDYVGENRNTYDPEFVKQVAKTNPNWLRDKDRRGGKR